MNFGILVHGGAGSNKRRIRKKAYNEQEEEIVKTIKQAACSGFDISDHDCIPVLIMMIIITTIIILTTLILVLLLMPYKQL
jgi:hypothetical protein